MSKKIIVRAKCPECGKGVIRATYDEKGKFISHGDAHIHYCFRSSQFGLALKAITMQRLWR
jgi:hypothetical protein